MSVASERIKNIPFIQSGIFKGHENSQFAIGMVATDGEIIDGYQREFDGAVKLRANTYLDLGFVAADDLDENGTELDEDDERSAHFVIIEQLAQRGFACVVGNMRLITKNNNELLPIEKYYPEVFTDPLPQKTVEVSRLISRHDNPTKQSLLKWPLFIAGFKHVDENKLGPSFGLLKPNLVRSLVLQGVPITPLAEAKYIQEINASKEPVQIDLPRLKRVIDLTGDQGIDIHDGGFSYLNFTNQEEEL